MARKLEEDLTEETAPKKRGARSPSKLPVLKVAAYSLLAFVALGSGLYGMHVTERFFILDTRFALNGGEESEQTLAVAGTSYASVPALRSVFHDDLGKSIYLLPLEERRTRLRTVDWVKEASVARLWPNRVMVRVWERTPVAFLPIENSSYALIDEDGVILPTVSGRFRLPVLHGVKTSAPQADRKERVKSMLRLTQELGVASKDLSEIDVSDKDNLKVMQPYERRELTLMLGDHNFAARYKNFIQHFSEIRRRLPDAVTLDLRLEDRITVVE